MAKAARRRKITGKSGHPVPVSTLAPLASLGEPTEAQRINRRVMRTEWADPSDLSPNRRNAHVVKGWRQPCMLRWCRTRHKSQSPFTAEHVVAADELRRIWDLVAVGMAGKKEPWVYTDIVAQPKLGPTWSEMKRYNAWRELGRVRKRFSDHDWELLGWVVLGNLSMGKWVEKEHAAGKRCTAPVVKTTLVGMLDVLVEHFGDTVRRADLSLVA
jgi:hypothetical protein